MRLHRPLLLGASVLALTGAVQAQTDTTVLAPIIVNGAEDPTGPVDGFVATSQASATKTDTPRLETQQSDSIITAEQIEVQGATTLGQALNYSSGVFGEPFGLDARGDSPRLRGFDGGNSQFLNGLKLLRGNTTPSFEIYGLERVEVLHGPAGVLYGAGNPGGIINQIQKRPQFEEFNEAGLSFGTNERAETFFDLNRMINEDVAYRFTGVLRHQNGNPDEVNDDRVYLAPAVTWNVTGQDTVTFLGSYQWDNPEEPTATVPTALGGSDPLGSDFYIGDEDFNTSKRRQTNIGLEWEHRFNDLWTLNQSFRYSKFDWESEWLSFSSVTGDTINRYPTLQDENSDTVNLDTRLTGAVRTGGVEHRLLFGLDIRRYDSDVISGFGSAPGLSLSDPDRSVDFDPAYGLTESDTRLTQTGLYAQDEMSFGRWRATLGVRQDWAKQEGDLNGTDIDTSDRETSGRVGLSYVFDNGLAPFVSYAESFDPKILTPYDLDTVAPSTGKQWEVGVKYQPDAFNGFVTATAFDLKKQNESYGAQELNENGQPVPVIRQRDQDAKGFELEGVAELTDQWTLRGSYSYIDSEIKGGPTDGNKPENTPRNVANLWLGYDFAEAGPLQGLSVGGGVRYFDARYGDAANTSRLGDETLLDASVGYRRGAVDARLTVQNLTDEEYFGSCNQFGCRYAAERTVVADVAYKW